MGKRIRNRQPTMWVTTTDLPTAASYPFYRRLNQLLREHRFDDFVEAQCAGFYAETLGRPGLPPGIYFRLLLGNVSLSPPSSHVKDIKRERCQTRTCRRWHALREVGRRAPVARDERALQRTSWRVRPVCRVPVPCRAIEDQE
jgi:hypothetical protein